MGPDILWDQFSDIWQKLSSGVVTCQESLLEGLNLTRHYMLKRQQVAVPSLLQHL
jgi:hypothetical protein